MGPRLWEATEDGEWEHTRACTPQSHLCAALGPTRVAEGQWSAAISSLLGPCALLCVDLEEQWAEVQKATECGAYVYDVLVVY